MGANSIQSSSGSAAIGGGHAGIPVSAEPDVAVLTLDDRGMICDCNGAGEALFRYHRSELVWRHVSMVLPQLAEYEVSTGGQINPYLKYLCRLGRHFYIATKGGESLVSQLFFNLIRSNSHTRLSLIVRRVEQ